MNPLDVRHWRRRYLAVAAAERESLRSTGPQPSWAVAVSLELFEASPIDPRSPLQRALRDSDAAPVRARWRRMKERLVP